MPSITQEREAYKLNGSFEYPDFFEKFKKARKSVWSPEEVIFEKDLRDWQECSQEEREIIGGILRGFTQLECHVGDYWSNIPVWFPKHEIAAVANEHAASERVHAWAYNFLSDTLGLDEFEAFLGDPAARQKVSFFMEDRTIKESLAIFSGAAEGVSLFSSFAVLLSFNLIGKFKALCQIISWSALDEIQHSETGIALFNHLCDEQPLTDEERRNIIKGFQLFVDKEFKYLRSVFKGNKLTNENQRLSEESLREYIKMMANIKLAEMRIHGFRFPYNYAVANEIKEWFHPLIKGNTSTDFFSQAKDGSNYIAKPTQDFMSVNLRTLDFSVA